MSFSTDKYIVGHSFLDDLEIDEEKLYDLYCFEGSFNYISWQSLLFDLSLGKRFDMKDDYYVIKKKTDTTSLNGSSNPIWGVDYNAKPEGTFCRHDKKYINKVSNTLKFWYCPDCKKDLGDA